MNKIDLIIEAIRLAEYHVKARGWGDDIDLELYTEALAAARDLQALKPVAHMYPSTLKDFEHGEKADYAFSIEMGNMKTGEETIPLYALYALDEVTK